MQIRSLDATLTRVAPTSTTATQRSSAAAALSAPNADTAAPRAAAADDRTLPGPGLAGLSAGWQRQVAGAQQGLAYLDRLAQGLADVKTGLSRTLALGTDAPTALRQQRDAVAALWDQRQAATSGALDNQGTWVADGLARRKFQIRGLDQSSLQSPEREALSFSVPGVRQPLTLLLGGERSADQAVRALDSALAPADLQTQVGDDGTVWVSVAEDRWPALRDGLTVRGGGQRFPAGQPTRPRLDAQPDILQARAWRLETPADQRATLQAVVRAQAWVQQQSDQLRGRLASWADALPATTPEDGTQALATADQTARQLGDSAGFGAWTTLLPALGTLRRERVEAVLTPR